MAIYEQDVVMFETKENGDKVIKMPISRANNIEGIGRSANTAYVVGDIVYVDNNKKVALRCTTAGTTSNAELDVSGVSIGNVITDGSVVWQVCNRTSDVTSVNGKTGDVVVDLPVGHMYWSVEPNVPTGRLPALGATYNRALYADLWAWANSVGLVKSESEWQAIASANGGNCAYYSSGDGSSTFRVPKLPTTIVTDASDGEIPVVGNGMALGITDGKNFRAFGIGSNAATTYSGIGYGASLPAIGTSGGASWTTGAIIGVTSDSSKSGIVAKTSATKITGQWLIVAFGVAHNVGEADVANVMQAVEQVQTGLREIESKMPSYKPNWNGYVQKTGTSFTAPSNGMVYLWNGTASNKYASALYVNSKQVGKHGVGNEGWTGQYGTLVAFVASGDVVSWSQSGDICYFVPFA